MIRGGEDGRSVYSGVRIWNVLKLSQRFFFRFFMDGKLKMRAGGGYYVLHWFCSPRVLRSVMLALLE